MSSVIQIKPLSKNNGFTLCLMGGVGLCLWLILQQTSLRSYWLPLMVLIATSLTVLVIGTFKLRQLAITLELYRDRVDYYHLKGQWSLKWDNIRRIDIPKVHHGLEHVDLPYIGIRLKDIDPLLDSLSPRLASNLLMQQRVLTLHQSNCDSIACYSDGLIEEDTYLSPSGKRYTGLVAMFANRMLKLRQALGYDLYIEQSELDRSPENFVALMKQCQQFTHA